MNRLVAQVALASTALVLAGLRDVRASVADDIRNMTGARTRLVWMQDQSGDGSDVGGRGTNHKLMGFDTDDGLGERAILSAVSGYRKPLLSDDGSRVVFSNAGNSKVYVVNWDGTGLREIAGGFASDVWEEPSTGVDWVYVRTGGDSTNNPIYRYQVDNPAVSELIWNRTQVDYEWMVWFQVSADGTRAGGSFPWSDCGVAVLPNVSWQRYGDGCLPSIAPDNSYSLFHFLGNHSQISVYDHGGGNKRTFDINDAPGIGGADVYFPKWSNDPRFMTVVGPMAVGASWGSTNVELYLGEFNSGYTGITRWISVTNNNKGDYWGDAWIAPLAPANVRIDSFSADPADIAEGQQSTLSWTTTNATSVSIDQGVGAVSADGSVDVSPSTTTTYTLTAQGTGGPVSRQVTVTVQTLRDPDNPGSTQAGLEVRYYELSSPSSLPDFGALTPYASDVVGQIDYASTNGDFATSGRVDNVGAVFTGYLDVPTDGIYTLYVESDDGSALYIGGTKVVDNDGLHGMTELSGQIGLRAGKHALRVEFFEAAGGTGLIVKYAGPGISGTPVIPASALSHVAAARQLSSIQVTPSAGHALPSGTAQFTAYAKDQYGDPIAAVISWSVTGGGSMSPGSSVSAVTEHTSSFTSSGAEGTFTVTASSGGVGGTASVTVASEAPIHLKINTGSNTYDVAGWERDDAYVTGGSDHTFSNAADTSGEPGAAPLDVYRSCRHGDHTYDFPSVADGTYTVRLHFYDEYGSDRAMDYTIEGVKVLDDFSIEAEVGTGKALVKEFTVVVSDGDGLQIVPDKDLGNDVFECGIEIVGSGAENEAPSVEAGTNQTVEVGVAAGLVATVTDDGLPTGTLTYQWTKRSGPGNVTFGDAAAEDTTATFSAAGDYVLRLTASDGVLQGYDEVTVTVVSPGEPTITLISPNGGEVWYVGLTYHVEWQSSNLDHASIYYSTDGGVSTKTLADVVRQGDSGWLRYPWVVPDEPSTQCIVHISGYFHEAPTQSAGLFEIRRPADGDGDGMDDGWEMSNFGDLTHDGTADTDADGLTDLQEFQHGTDPRISDTDGDGMPDKWEIDYQLDPTVDDSGLDPDGDGYSNLEEYSRGGDPRDPNSPGDDEDGTGFGCEPGTESGTGGAGRKLPGAGAPLPGGLCLVLLAAMISVAAHRPARGEKLARRGGRVFCRAARKMIHPA